MSELLTGLAVVGKVLAIWTMGSLVAVVPLVLWFRAQAIANEVRFRQGRRQAWLAEARPADIG
jgi:hypothetical protein